MAEDFWGLERYELLAVTEPPPLPQWSEWIRFEQVASDKNRFREYVISLSQNLLGEWAVSCSWGRIGGRKRVRVTYFSSKREATVRAEQLARRLLRGYHISAFESPVLIQG